MCVFKITVSEGPFIHSYIVLSSLDYHLKQFRSMSNNYFLRWLCFVVDLVACLLVWLTRESPVMAADFLDALSLPPLLLPTLPPPLPPPTS